MKPRPTLRSGVVWRNPAQPPGRNGRRALGAVPLLVACVSLAPGCAVFSWIGTMLENPVIEALYEPANRPTLMLVDDPQRALVLATLPEAIAQEVARRLTQAGVVEHWIAPQSLEAYRAARGAAFDTLAIDRIGRELGAEQVIYVKVVAIEAAGHNPAPRYEAVLDVKVVDAVTRRRLFPDLASSNRDAATLGGQDRGHYRIRVAPPVKDFMDDRPETGDALWRQLGHELARTIARLFHRHKLHDA